MARWFVSLLGIALVAWLVLRPDASPAPPLPTTGGRMGEVAEVRAVTATAERAPNGVEGAAVAREAGVVRHELSGRVVDGDGRPLADVPVHVAADPLLSPQELLRRAQRGDFLTALASAVTDRDGGYRLTLGEAPEARLQVHALPPHHGDAALRRVQLAGAATQLPDLVVSAERPVRALVVDAATQAPIAGARVQAFANGLSILRLPGREAGRSATTGDDGVAALPGLPVGSYTFRAEATGHAAGEQLQQAVQAEEDAEIVFALAPGASIGGQVFDAAGRPVAGARVVAEPLDAIATTRVAASTDAAGRFALAGVRTGEHRLQVGKVGFVTGVFEPIAAGAEGLVCTLQRQGAIRLTVVDANGAAVDACTVTARPAGAVAGLREHPPRRFRPTDREDGAFVVTDLDPGEWTLRVAGAGFASATSAPCVVVVDQVVAAQVVVTAGATLRLLTRGSDGAALVGARAALQPDGFADGPAAAVFAPLQGSDGLPDAVTAAAGGAIALPHVAPGGYQLRLDVAGRAPHYVRGIAVGAADVDLGVVIVPVATRLFGSALLGDVIDRTIVVQVLALGEGNLPAGFRVDAAVDAAGTWRCGTALPAGRYAVVAGRRRADDPFLENQDDAASRVEVTVDGGAAEQRVDLRIVR